jgi:hypothetical protein
MLKHLKYLSKGQERDIKLMISSLLSKVDMNTESAVLPNHEIQNICVDEYEE